MSSSATSSCSVDIPALTSLSHGGGCGCKIAPAVLQRIMSAVPPGVVPPQLLVGAESSDDAAVYRLNDTQALVATTDFFTPIVDVPHDFGRIAATNALSDVYAMGATPIMALAIVGMPLDKLPPAAIAEILAGGASVCQQAGIPVAGGHSIDIPEPVYGLVALGLARPEHIKTNRGAHAGDVLILGKPLGVGILSAALKKGLLDDAGYAAMLAATTQLNRVGNVLGMLPGVHAMTDVTGFGLAGHVLEMCRGAALDAHIHWPAVPIMDVVQQQFVQQGAITVATGASRRNWDSYGDNTHMAPELPPAAQTLLTDPQTAGGLLVACSADSAAGVLAAFANAGFAHASVIGYMRSPQQPDSPCLHVLASELVYTLPT